ncbi:NADH-quinone oxidoreductase subunit A [Halomonas sp. GXIMD04776]|uniref:NADH-quinone oxidoreductase subunit A n=1 Tax=Halomonas sp. GXIMD04776 TaxID=3415605 RepID=UPI003C91E77D
MELLTLFFIMSIALGGGLWLQWWPRRHQPMPTYPQRAPFLGGGLPETHAWSRFHVRYYPMTLLLIAFEMEMMFMYPWAVVYVEQGLKAVMEMGMFLAILSVGIVYGWREGVFKWQ